MEKDRAKDMESLYAFCRLMDDIADADGIPESEKRAELERWKAEITDAYDSERPLSDLGEEMRSLVRRRKIPQQYMLDIIEGVMRDTTGEPFETFEDIRKYCYGVASAVGLASIYVFGFKNERTKDFAEALGYALQFTNILRDVVDDIKSHGRVYIPSAELKAFGVSRRDLLESPHSAKCRRLFAFMYFRAKHFFNKSRRLLQPEDKRSMAPALIMWAIYEEILESIKKSGFLITESPVKISKPKKIALALGAICRSKQPEPPGKKSGRAIVLGAGVAGIGAALRLAAEGFDVSLYEASSRIGGRCAAIEWNGIRLDNGTHAAMGCYKNFFAMLGQIGTNSEEFFKPVERMDFIFGNGEKATVSLPGKSAGVLSKIFSFLNYLKLDGTLGMLPLLLSLKFGIVKAKDGETALDFLLRKGICKRCIENFWEPFCVSALNTPLSRAEARLMLKTAKKSLLGRGDSGALYLPQKPIADALAPAITYLKGVGAGIHLGERVSEIHFEGNCATGISTDKCEHAACEFLASSLNLSAFKKLLPDTSKIKGRISNISVSGVSNIYFSTNKKLIDGNYACLIGSPLHWIFDKTPNAAQGETRIYGITISASESTMSKAEAEKLLKNELEKFFGEVEISGILPATFAEATISADPESEAARPKQPELGEFSNMAICGDWIQTDLPCTMESAAKSSKDFRI